jgi:alkylation response protein AidB-like acyl-CoA dehydrogenase
MIKLRPALETSPLDEILARIEDLAPLFRDCAGEADRLARLPKHVVRALVRYGLFRLWVPRKCAGFEFDLPDALRAYQAAARIDGSIGWAVMTGSSGALLSACFDAPTAAAIFARPETVIAASNMPEGRATRVAGGYRVNGCWRGVTGSHYATTFIASCVVMDAGTLAFDRDGRPLTRTMAFDASQVAILPAWDPSGLRGTGSDDFEVRDVFVPEQRGFSSADSPRETGPLYRLPVGLMTELSVVAVALGIGRHALDAFAAFARRQRVSGSGVPLADEPAVQSRFAEAQACWRLAKAGLDAWARQAWDTALASKALTASELGEITAGCVLGVAKLRAAIGELMALAGMGSIPSDDELTRAWRDLQTVAAHGALSPLQLTTSGARLLAAGS